MEPSFLVQDQICQRFSLDQIRSATQDFDEALVVGSGGFGKVYKGQIINDGSSTVVAIKRSNSTSNQGATEFQAEIQMLSKVRHCNLVSLIGYWYEGTEMALVYEYMPEGTLEDHLHKSGARLSWLQLLKICIGAARGLDYLHTGTGTQHGIIHRDVKSSNVLLDKNFAAKISDFGLAKIGPTNQTRTHVSTMVKGTFGYLDPRYVYTGELTRKSDVYSFGVVLLEVICGRPAVDTSLDEEDQWGLAPWAQDRIKEGKRNHIVDLRLRGQISSNCLKGFIGIASQCLHNQPNQRPKMAEIVTRLEVLLSLQEREGSSIAEGKFKGKVWSFFQAKVESKDTEGEPNEKDREGKNTSTSVPPSPQSPRSLAEGNFKSFSFNVLETATDNFGLHRVLEHNGRSYFKGWIDEKSLVAVKPGTGTPIVVRRIKQSNPYSLYDWLDKIEYLGQLNHPNLVKLIGYCVNGNHRYVVSEFMAQGSLEDHLFRRGANFKPLSWNLRVKIAVDAAKGLAYLHSQKENVKIYGNIKASTILVDSGHNGKLSKFGLTEDVEVSSLRDTFGTIEFASLRYAAPEYSATGHITTRSEIYSFGLVLLEILTGKQNIDNKRPTRERILVDFARPYLTRKHGILQIIDPCIAGQYLRIVALRFAIILKECLSINPGDRPTAEKVVKALEEIQDLQKCAPSPREAVRQLVAWASASASTGSSLQKC